MKKILSLFETNMSNACIKSNQYLLKKTLMKYFTITFVFLTAFTLNINGQCVDGNCHKGHGTFEWESGDTYIGSWVNGLPDGNGKFIWANGDKYNGNFEEGKLSGRGTYKWKNGNTYTGQWKNNQMNGRGTYHWVSDGATYDGFFQDDKITNSETDDSQDIPEGKD